MCELQPASYLSPSQPLASSIGIDAWTTHLVQLSSPEQYNSVRDTFLLSIARNRTNLTLNSRPAVFRLFSEKLRRSWKVIKSTQCRRRWATSSTTDTDVSCLRRVTTTARPRPLLPTKCYHYTLQSTSTCRDSEAHAVNTSSTSPCRWPHGSDNVPPSSTSHRRRCPVLTPRR